MNNQCGRDAAGKLSEEYTDGIPGYQSSLATFPYELERTQGLCRSNIHPLTRQVLNDPPSLLCVRLHRNPTYVGRAVRLIVAARQIDTTKRPARRLCAKVRALRDAVSA